MKRPAHAKLHAYLLRACADPGLPPAVRKGALQLAATILDHTLGNYEWDPRGRFVWDSSSDQDVTDGSVFVRACFEAVNAYAAKDLKS